MFAAWASEWATWVGQGRYRVTRIVRGLVFAYLLSLLWPGFFIYDLPEIAGRTLARMPTHRVRRIRQTARGLAYASPFALPVVASGGREMSEGVVWLMGLLSAYSVSVLCQPRKWEQWLLLALLGFWMLVALLPVLMMD